MSSDEDEDSDGGSEIDRFEDGHKDVVMFEEELKSMTTSSREVDSSMGPLKKSKYSNFYYKLEALNEKIKVYKDVFYSRENHFIGNKGDPRNQKKASLGKESSKKEESQ